MKLRIDKAALDLAFRMLLTCGCPITEDEEQLVFNLLQDTKDGETIDYIKIFSIFPSKENTVFHRISDFTVWQAPIDVDTYSINRNHIIRHFASSYHWNHVVANGLNEGYKQVISISSWFLSHMLLPVKITNINDGLASAEYEYGDGTIQFSNVFAPMAYKPRNGEIWAVHFAGLLDRLSPDEHRTAILMLESNNLLKEFRTDVFEIDFLNFERKGNYSDFCRERYEKYYPRYNK